VSRRTTAFSLLAGAALLLAGCASSVSGDAGTQSQQTPPAPPTSSSATAGAQQSTDQPPPSVVDSPTGASPSTEAPTTEAPTSETPTTEAPTSATVTTTAPRTSSAPVTVPATSAPVQVTTVMHTATVTGGQPAGGGPALHIEHFTSPSGNISCLIMTDTEPQVRCDLAESAIPKEHDCGGTGDWGLSVTLVAGHKAAMECISDTVMQPGIPTLAYGQKTTVGAITCTSSEDGMHCADTSGHGFRLARASYDVS
jgi:hypothetical protein